MRHQFDYADSLRRTPSVVLSLALRPFSIGMELELLRVRSPFVICQKFTEIEQLSEENQLAALIYAVDVCSQSENERSESGHLLETRFSWWQIADRRAVRRLKKIWKIWEAHIATIKLEDELAKFWNYLSTGKTGPEFAKPEGNSPGTPIGAPECCILLHYIRSLPADRTMAWGGELDWPLAIVRYEYYTLLESQGKVQLKSDFVETFDDFCRKMEAKFASGEIKHPDLTPRPAPRAHAPKTEAACQL